MASHFLLALFSLIAYSHVASSTVTPQQMLAAATNFSKDFAWPRISEVAAQINYTGFTPDVVGRVDDTNSYEGRELNTEYIFGLFSSLANINTTRLIGFPNNSTITALAIDPPIIVFSDLRDFDWGPVTVPMQIDVWFLIDDSGLIAQYDIVFRRFEWTFDYVKPFLRPQLIEELGSLADGYKDDDDLMHLRAAIDICQAHETYCHGADQQYESTRACMDYIHQKVPFGKVYEWGGDTAMCRYIHTGMIKYRPDVHCPHIGPSGGGMCIEREYVKETTQKLYPVPFLPPTAG